MVLSFVAKHECRPAVQPVEETGAPDHQEKEGRRAGGGSRQSSRHATTHLDRIMRNWAAYTTQPRR